MVLINHSNEPFAIEFGDRIAQMVFAKVEKVKWKVVKELKETVRGVLGFGSTGKK